MLIDKGVSAGEVITLKLTSGEEIVAKLSEETATYKYYGFANSAGWKIKRKTLATEVWEVASGTGDFDTAWTDRATQTYDYF
jgi:hypothetical protein